MAPIISSRDCKPEPGTISIHDSGLLGVCIILSVSLLFVIVLLVRAEWFMLQMRNSSPDIHEVSIPRTEAEMQALRQNETQSCCCSCTARTGSQGSTLVGIAGACAERDRSRSTQEMSLTDHTSNDGVLALPPLSLAYRFPGAPGDIQMGVLDGERPLSMKIESRV